MNPSTLDLADRLRGVGLRVTAPRLAVLAALAEGTSHAPAAEVAAAVRGPLRSISTQSVYNILDALVDAGLVRRIQPAGSAARYEVRVGDNHHHAVCRQCGATADIDCAVGVTPCLTAADGSAYEIDEAEVIYWGRCPECVAATATPTGGSVRSGGAHHQPGAVAPVPGEPQPSATSN